MKLNLTQSRSFAPPPNIWPGASVNCTGQVLDVNATLYLAANTNCALTNITTNTQRHPHSRQFTGLPDIKSVSALTSQSKSIISGDSAFGTRARWSASIFTHRILHVLRPGLYLLARGFNSPAQNGWPPYEVQSRPTAV